MDRRPPLPVRNDTSLKTPPERNFGVEVDGRPIFYQVMIDTNYILGTLMYTWTFLKWSLWTELNGPAWQRRNQPSVNTVHILWIIWTQRVFLGEFPFTTVSLFKLFWVMMGVHNQFLPQIFPNRFHDSVLSSTSKTRFPSMQIKQPNPLGCNFVRWTCIYDIAWEYFKILT